MWWLGSRNTQALWKSVYEFNSGGESIIQESPQRVDWDCAAREDKPP